MELPDAIGHAALFPESELPAFPPGHPTRQTEVEDVVGAVRRLLRAERREQGIWFVPEATSPAGVVDPLSSAD